MDLQRLMELEKLAGLHLHADERAALLDDLVELEKFASLLPEISTTHDKEFLDDKQVKEILEPLAMDNFQADANAPSKTNGFYETAPTKPPSEGGSE